MENPNQTQRTIRDVYKVDVEKQGITCDSPKNREDALAKGKWFEDVGWQSHIRERIKFVETEELTIRWDSFGRIFTMCVKDFFMLDIDTKDGEDKDKTVKQIEEYCEIMHDFGIDLKFLIIESDRGIHALLMNERVNPQSIEHLEISLDLCVDIDYIGFSANSGFCQRLSPKIINRYKSTEFDTVLYSKEQISNEFIGRLGYKGKTLVGYGEVIPEFNAYVELYFKGVELLKWIYQQPNVNLEAYFNTLRKGISVNGITHDEIIAPPQAFSDNLVAWFNNQIQELNIPIGGKYRPERIKERWIDKLDNFLERQAYYQCGGLTEDTINQRTLDVVIRNWKKECGWQAVSVGGPDVKELDLGYERKITKNPSGRSYPFVFGINGLNRLIFIQFAQLWMGDWDVKEGYPKDLPPKIIETYFQDEKTRMPSNERLFKIYPRFKWYESDNGTHGFLVSGDLNYNERFSDPYKISRPLVLMQRLCVDGWYIAFVKFRGYSIRVGPKFGDRPNAANAPIGEDGFPLLNYKSREEVESQFVQNEGVFDSEKQERVFYTGEGPIDPYLDSLTDFIMDIKQKILEYPDLYQRIQDNLIEVSGDLGELVKESYDRICRQYERNLDPRRLKDLNDWADSIWRCPRKYPEFNTAL